MLWVGVLAAAAPARAQLLDQIRNPDIPGTGTEPGVTVLSRLRPEYDYKTVRVGSLVLRPELVSSTGYDDNVLGRPRAVGSVLQVTQSALDVRTDWSRHGVFANVTVEDNQFFDQPRQSYTNWAASAGGRYDIGRDTASVNFYHQNLNQTPRDLNSASIDSSIAYRVDTVQAAYNAVFNRISVQPAVQVSMYNFDDGIVGGQVYRQAFRNRTVATPNVTVNYEVAPRRNLVAVVRNAVASYRTPDTGGFVRDFNDTSVLGGLDYQGPGPWRYRALIGYERRVFSSAAFRTIQAPIAELSVNYNLSGLTTLTTTLTRRIADSADEGTAGLTETAAQFSVDHELKRNILLRGETRVALAEFGNSGGTQTLYSAGASATWLLNRNMRLAASYGFTARESRSQGFQANTFALGTNAVLGSNYIENRYLLRLSLGL
ncbi:MAG: outer membrane beta-barrel protein [Janthinobacterium lividum]